MITKFLQKKILNHVFGDVPYVAPDNLYLALFTASPVDADGDLVAANEVSGNDYARISFANDGTMFEALDPDDHDVAGEMPNALVKTFPTPTGAWGTITYLGILDESENLLAYAEISPSVVVGAGRVVSFPVGYLTIDANNC